jgi:hypothetical protein
MATLDFDHTFGLWLKDIPYWWCPGKTPDTGRRFYVVHPNAAAVFDSKQRIADPTWVQHEMFCHRLYTGETFCFFPITGIHRDMNLQYIFPGDKAAGESKGLYVKLKFPYPRAELRINGNPADPADLELGKPLFNVLFENNLVTLVNATGPVRDELTYPWRFGNYFACQRGIKAHIEYRTKKECHKFSTIAELRHKWQLNPGAVSEIHQYALRAEKGWRYIDYGATNWATAQLLFEIAIGERPMFLLRDNRDGIPIGSFKTREELRRATISEGLKHQPCNTEFKLEALELKLKDLFVSRAPQPTKIYQQPQPQPQPTLTAEQKKARDALFVEPELEYEDDRIVTNDGCEVETYAEPLPNSDDEEDYAYNPDDYDD